MEKEEEVEESKVWKLVEWKEARDYIELINGNYISLGEDKHRFSMYFGSKEFSVGDEKEGNRKW